MARTATRGRSWLYLGILLIALLGTGACLFLLFVQLLERERSAVIAPSVEANPAPTVLQNSEELETKAKGLELVLQQSDKNTDALEGLVKVRLEQGNLREALVPLEKLADLKPQIPDYRILLAEGKQQIGDSEAAFAAYEKVLNSSPGNIKALQGMVNLQLAQNRPEGAIGRLQDTLKIAAQANATSPGQWDIVSIQLLLAQVYVRQNRLTEANAVYDQAIEANPQDFRPVFAKATILKQQGLDAAAKPLFIRAANLAPPKYKDQLKQIVDQFPADSSPAKEPAKANP
ncbi:tetratricopeptide repeat protein [Oscillatoria sp. FACHB-1406]|uniref:tetratricopeptide repeat protein n=1 Tax=Oscillatoria sp. FACHB-1406 TaxID=2692846 RepID=UPI001683CA57|nr:tetratricopeptide repeat protein [Oscillatoria sp. FACHB-1406]MBD2578630.1 tetratricopeptide repeat protein [Oscillatoria sp. FACHB-1406]